MKILHTVEVYYPSLGGMQEAVGHISENLVKSGHEVTVATSFHPKRKIKEINGVHIQQFNIRGNEVMGYQGDVDEYKNFLLQSEYDVITNFAAQQWATDLALPLLSRIKGKKVLVPTGFSGLRNPRYADYFERIKILMKEYDLNIFLSSTYQDIEFARKNGVDKYVVIPNGAAIKEFSRPVTIDIREELNINKNNFLILLVGSHTGFKGHKEAIRIFNRANIKNSTLLIVGNYTKLISRGGLCKTRCKLSECHNKIFDSCKSLLVKELSRDQVLAAYNSADLFLFPSNIECSPVVLYESLASHTPFLSADVGNAKEIATGSGGGSILPTLIDENGFSQVDIDTSAVMLTDLYNNEPKRSTMALSGYQAWLAHYNWEGISQQYEKIYRQLVSNV